MNIYNFNIRRLIKYLLPVSLRTNIVDLLNSLCSPFDYTHTSFMIFRCQQLDDLSYNSQYPNLQRLLNDRFDDSSRRIKVYDGASIPGIIIYPNAEQIAVITPLPVRPNMEYINYPFVVELPQDFENNINIINQIIRTVDTYKFAGVKYKIFFSNE